MLCGNCRALILDTARFCYNCGSELKENIPAPELNILIAEDNQHMASLLRTWLENAGMHSIASAVISSFVLVLVVVLGKTGKSRTRRSTRTITR